MNVGTTEVRVGKEWRRWKGPFVPGPRSRLRQRYAISQLTFDEIDAKAMAGSGYGCREDVFVRRRLSGMTLYFVMREGLAAVVFPRSGARNRSILFYAYRAVGVRELPALERHIERILK
ncbi:MAG TPA: hypothetical protein VJB97_00185 [Candidatus Paceibacterota bacterium]